MRFASARPCPQVPGFPPGREGLTAFRRWVASDEAPHGARIDFLDGDVAVETATDLQAHAAVQAELAYSITGLARRPDLGQVYAGGALLVSEEAGLACQPDVLAVSWAALRSGRVRYLPAPGQAYDEPTEVHGAADLAVEVADPPTRDRDRRLVALYARAGVRELWLVEAGGPAPRLRVLALESGAYVPAPCVRGDASVSRVLGHAVRLQVTPGRFPGTLRTRLEAWPLEPAAHP